MAPPAAEAPPVVNVVSAADVAHDEVLGWVGLFLFWLCLFYVHSLLKKQVRELSTSFV